MTVVVSSPNFYNGARGSYNKLSIQKAVERIQSRKKKESMRLPTGKKAEAPGVLSHGDRVR